MTDTTRPATRSRKARRLTRSSMRVLRSDAMSISGPNPFSSGCVKVSVVVDASSPGPSTGFDQFNWNVPPVGTLRRGPTETVEAQSRSLPSEIPTVALACGR